ncbi:helix-turn-helix domain-containing protein [Microbacterium sp. gxy059]|uniref:helix-turn-helix domain-containing protein n=1 Tax=Microbacterium sp. gxy059 TaxID=2957199 RepID=UPI003D98FE8D
MNTGVVISDEVLDKVRAATRAGRSASQIAEELGVSVRSVQRWRARVKVARPAVVRRPDDARARARELVEDGASFNEAARTLGISPTTIRRWFPDLPAWPNDEVTEFANAVRKAGVL